MSGTIERLPSRPPLPDPSDWTETGFPATRTVPATDDIHVEERLAEGTYVLRAELPGVDPAEDIEITVTEGFLTLRAERSVETAQKHRATFRYGHCTPLPTGAKDDEATAEYEHGVLTITMPVPETETATKTIPVR